MDIGSPKFRWDIALWEWRDSGKFSGIATCIREGIPIPKNRREEVAGAIVGAPRGVPPNHKNYSYRMLYQQRAELSLKVKSEIRVFKKDYKKGKLNLVDLPEPVRLYVTGARGCGINQTVSEAIYLETVQAMNDPFASRVSLYWCSALLEFQRNGLSFTEKSVSDASAQLSPKTRLPIKGKNKET